MTSSGAGAAGFIIKDTTHCDSMRGIENIFFGMRYPRQDISEKVIVKGKEYQIPDLLRHS